MRHLELSEIQQRKLHIHQQGIFKGIGESDLQALEQAGQWLETDGDMIIQDGHEQNYLYLVVAGKVEVFKYNLETKKKQILATLEKGACMGEIAFIRGDVASANVKALKKTILWRIDHACMQQYISEYPGGGQLCLNLADILAQRVQEGNTRLIGVSQSLSAYFGHMARQADRDIEAPLAAGLADMEVPREIYDRFICDVMEYPEGSELTDEHRNYVDALVKDNQADLISWLEAGQRGQKLKVILKFVPLDSDGNVITQDEEDEDTHEEPATAQTQDTAEASSTPAQQAPKPRARPRPRPRRQQGHIVSVPQVQARVKGHTAVIKEKPDRIWQLVHYGAYVLLPFVTALMILKFLPIESRAGLAKSETYQAFNVGGFVDMVIFQPSEFVQELDFLPKVPIRGNLVLPQEGYFNIRIKTSEPMTQDTPVKIKFSDNDTFKNYIDQTYTLKAGESEHLIESMILPPAHIDFEIQSLQWSEPVSNTATLEAIGKH